MRTVIPVRIIRSRWRTVRGECSESRPVTCWRRSSCGAIVTHARREDDTAEIQSIPIEEGTRHQGARQRTGLGGRGFVFRGQRKKPSREHPPRRAKKEAAAPGGCRGWGEVRERRRGGEGAKRKRG